MCNFFWFIINFVCPIIVALASIGALYVAFAELSDYRRVQINIRFAPPIPEAETKSVRKLALVVENQGRKAVKNIKINCPQLCFGYTSNCIHTVTIKNLNINSQEAFNCFDCMGDILEHAYTFCIEWENWLKIKKKMTKEIYWDMYSSQYPPLPEITPEPISEEEQIERILNS